MSILKMNALCPRALSNSSYCLIFFCVLLLCKHIKGTVEPGYYQRLQRDFLRKGFILHPELFLVVHYKQCIIIRLFSNPQEPFAIANY